MNEHIHCERDGEPVKAPYHYAECGLDNVYLLSGYDVAPSDYGESVSIRHADELHRAIGMTLVCTRKILAGKELRFLRKEMEVTQAHLGRLLGVTDQAVARWEKGQTQIPRTADYLVRIVFADYVGQLKYMAVDGLIMELEQRDAGQNDEPMDFERRAHAWRQRALAA